MDKKLTVQKGHLRELGIHRMGDGILIVSDIRGRKNCGIYLYPEEKDEQKSQNKTKEYKIPFTDDYLIGGLYCVFLPDFSYKSFDYLFYADDERLTDPRARLLDSSSKFGHASKREKPIKCRFCRDDFTQDGQDGFDWEEDTQPERPFCDSVIYKLHMRGFTKHSSSGVQNKGTFAGLEEKIPYLKELGITAVESMPVFEFEDKIFNPLYSEMDNSLLSYLDNSELAWRVKTNFWGYTGGNYFAPKRAYSVSERPDLELKKLVRSLHQNGIELLLDFYFPDQISPGFILDVCRFWVKEYHIDGFKLMGADIPVKLLATDPYLRRTKLIFESSVQLHGQEEGDYKHLAVMSAGFMYEARKYLKGDEDMLRSVTAYFRKNPRDHAVINEITSYQGFTLTDLVSYDRKHNEPNGENNRDGSDYNYSWNCGAEGKTRKKLVLALREQQKKNALLMMFASQGTPVLLAGDEFGNSAEGNNNPYCQDNSISWLLWKTNTSGEELLRFTKELIKFRRRHPVLHMGEAVQQSDHLLAGYPNISYHGDQAWHNGMENYNRHIGIMYCGSYAKSNNKKSGDFLYIAYNTHWIDHKFALPKLPDELSWKVKLATCPDKYIQTEQEGNKERGGYVTLPPRSIVILTGQACAKSRKQKRV